MRIFWTVLMERSIGQWAVLSLLDVAGVAALYKAVRFGLQYQRVDMARNNAVRLFLQHAKADDDVLIMLDADHTHPKEIVPHLANRCDAEHEVVGALAFRRSIPHDPCFYTLNEAGKADVPTEFTGGLQKCDIVGTGAIAIRRSVFRKLDAAGFPWPYFRFTYKDGLENEIQRTEDWQFGLNCKAAGIPHWVDTSIVTPHITDQLVDAQSWFDTLREAAANPEAANAKFKMLGMTFQKEGD